MTESEFKLAPTNCEVYYPDIQSVPNEEFAIIRRGGLGASDASVFLGQMVMFKKDIPGLVEEKLRTTLSEEEKAIGMLPNVRKGKELEDMILSKFAEHHGCEKPLKPRHMYKINDLEYLTVNYDGVIFEEDCYIPVEAKFVSTFGIKNYDPTRAFHREFPEYEYKPKVLPEKYYPDDINSVIAYRAARVGIPTYYYVQLQQQILGLDSPYGYLTTLADKNWESITYKAYRDDEVIRAIQIVGYQVHQKILNKKESNNERT